MLSTGGFSTISFQQYGSTSNTPGGNTSRYLWWLLGPVAPSLSPPDAASLGDTEGGGRRPGDYAVIYKSTDEYRPRVGNFFVLLILCPSIQLESEEKHIMMSTGSVLSLTSALLRLMWSYTHGWHDNKHINIRIQITGTNATGPDNICT